MPHHAARMARPIQVVWGNTSGLTSAQENFLKNSLVPRAVQFWADALSVDRVDGALYANRQCTSRWPNGKCQTYAPNTVCGSGAYTVDIPASMLGTDVRCHFRLCFCSVAVCTISGWA